MFDNQRYMTKGILESFPPEIRFFMWSCIDRLPEPKDYFQVFELSESGSMQCIVHFSEQPEYKMTYLIPTSNAINAKVYVIDSVDYSTMLLAEEY